MKAVAPVAPPDFVVELACAHGPRRVNAPLLIEVVPSSEPSRISALEDDTLIHHW